MSEEIPVPEVIELTEAETIVLFGAWVAFNGVPLRVARNFKGEIIYLPAQPKERNDENV